MKKNILLIADQHLDPRLRKRIEWLSRNNFNISISLLPRAKWFSVENIEKKFACYKYGSAELLNVQNSLIYISGIKALFDNFIYLLKMKNKNVIILEIPDLPLRSKLKLKNYLIMKVLNVLIRQITSNIVITSDRFREKLKNNLNYFLIENVVSYNVAIKLYNIPLKLPDTKIKIGYIGVIRYIDQLKMIIRFVSEFDNIELHIFGGPISRLKDCLKTNYNGKIFLYGEFNFERDIVKIYNTVDIVYSVYDAAQLNVKLALPNRLYEAVLAKKWILVAKNTYLGELVDRFQLGLQLSFDNYLEFSRDLNTFIEKIRDNVLCYNLDYSKKILSISFNQEKSYIQYIKGLMDENFSC